MFYFLHAKQTDGYTTETKPKKRDTQGERVVHGLVYMESKSVGGCRQRYCNIVRSVGAQSCLKTVLNSAEATLCSHILGTRSRYWNRCGHTLTQTHTQMQMVLLRSGKEPKLASYSTWLRLRLRLRLKRLNLVAGRFHFFAVKFNVVRACVCVCVCLCWVFLPGGHASTAHKYRRSFPASFATFRFSLSNSLNFTHMRVDALARSYSALLSLSLSLSFLQKCAHSRVSLSLN